MQPYQEASKEFQRQSELPKTILKNAAVGAATFLGGGATLNRVLPFLSRFVPEDLAIKGLNKIDPRFGKFFNKAMSNGQTFDQAKGFIESKIEESQPKKNKSPTGQRNIIDQYDPELTTYIKEKVGKGLPILEAGKKALGHSRFKKVIDKMTQDHKTSWDSILQNVFGSQESPQQTQQPQKQDQGQVQGQPQGLDPGIAQLLQQGNAILQKFKG